MTPSDGQPGRMLMKPGDLEALLTARAARPAAKAPSSGRRRRRVMAFPAPALVMPLLVLLATVALATPSTFVNITNFQPRHTAPGTFDWANSGAAGGTNTCAAGEIHVTGANGLFD